MEKKLVFQSTITCVCAGVKLTYKSNELVIGVTTSTAQSVIITPYIRTTPTKQADYFPRIYTCTTPICQSHSLQVHANTSPICQHDCSTRICHFPICKPHYSTRICPSAICQPDHSQQTYTCTYPICKPDCSPQIYPPCKNKSIFNPRKTLAHLKKRLRQSARKTSRGFCALNPTFPNTTQYTGRK